MPFVPLHDSAILGARVLRRAAMRALMSSILSRFFTSLVIGTGDDTNRLRAPERPDIGTAVRIADVVDVT